MVVVHDYDHLHHHFHDLQDHPYHQIDLVNLLYENMVFVAKDYNLEKKFLLVQQVQHQNFEVLLLLLLDELHLYHNQQLHHHQHILLE